MDSTTISLLQRMRQPGSYPKHSPVAPSRRIAGRSDLKEVNRSDLVRRGKARDMVLDNNRNRGTNTSIADRAAAIQSTDKVESCDGDRT